MRIEKELVIDSQRITVIVEDETLDLTTSTPDRCMELGRIAEQMFGTVDKKPIKAGVFVSLRIPPERRLQVHRVDFNFLGELGMEVSVQLVGGQVLKKTMTVFTNDDQEMFRRSVGRLVNLELLTWFLRSP